MQILRAQPFIRRLMDLMICRSPVSGVIKPTQRGSGGMPRAHGTSVCREPRSGSPMFGRLTMALKRSVERFAETASRRLADAIRIKRRALTCLSIT